MARRRKQRKIDEAMTFPNVFQSDVIKKGIWREYFNSIGPITLELGCGTGAYTLALAEMFPERNFIGVDIKGARLWTGAKLAMAKKLANVAFLRIPIETLEDYFAPAPVAEIWITFPDPFPKPKQAKHRLTAPRFLDTYKKILQPGGMIHFKTDDEALFDYTVESVEHAGGRILRAVKNLYAEPLPADSILGIQTRYETRHLADGKKIYYMVFKWR